MGIKKIISDCLNDTLKREDLERLINLCHRMALAYLRMKASSNRLYMIRGEKLEDLAWDFIADLFEKNRKGELVKLKEYFSEMDLHGFSESELKIELRKLVFTKVDDNIFRAVGEKDPSLRKIIRNLKLAIRNSDSKHRVCYKDSLIIVEQDERRQLPAMPSEFMQMKLCSRLDEKMQIPEIVIEVIDVLQHQDQYRKRFSLVALATIIRETFVHFHETTSEEKNKPQADLHLLNGEFEKFLTESIKTVKEDTGKKYVIKGKINGRQLDIYMNAAKDIVRDQFTDGRKEYSQFEYLKDHLPELEYETFRENDRQILEYLVKLVREDLVNIFKDEWN